MEAQTEKEKLHCVNISLSSFLPISLATAVHCELHFNIRKTTVKQ